MRAGFALALSLLLAPADVHHQLTVTCPVDGVKFEVTEITGTNHWGGRDADGCAHAFNTTPMESYVWVCPSCHFAGRKKEFEAALSEEERRTLREGLRPLEAIRRDARQKDIPGWIKYDLLAQVATLRKSPPEEVGRALLNASWCCRQKAAVYLADFDEWESLRDRYTLNQKPLQFGLGRNRTDFELDVARKIEKDIAQGQYERGPNRLLARYLAAYLFRKHGESAPAERWLRELSSEDPARKFKGENSVVDDAVARQLAILPVEREFQARALLAYRSAYEGGRLDPKVAPEVAYLLGELARHSGDPKGAIGWYEKALASSDSEPLKKMAAAQKALVEKP